MQPLETLSRPAGASLLDVLARTYKRDKDGQFSSGGGGVRDSLAAAETTADVNDVAMAELRELTGRRIGVQLYGMEVDDARETAEGVLRGVERHPQAGLLAVETYGVNDDGSTAGAEKRVQGDPTGRDALAVTSSGGTLSFNVAEGAHYRERIERAHAAGLGVSDGPMGLALHEYGHVVTQHGTAPAKAWEHAAAAAGGEGRREAHIEAELSKNATANGDELVGEAYAQVVAHGDRASPLAREIMDIVDQEYAAEHPSALLPLTVLGRAYKRDGSGRFASTDGGDRGIRDAFADAKSITSLEMAAEAELGSILGQRVAVKLGGLEMDAARAHVEGIARSAELYPHTDLISVTSYGPGGQVSDIPGQAPGAHDAVWGVSSSVVGRPGADIYLNTRIDAPKMRRVTNKAVAEGYVDGDGTDITWTGAHEMGHAAAAMMRPGVPQVAAVRIAAEVAGGSVDHVYSELRTTVSRYALTPSKSGQGSDELIGEATAQVASLGPIASPISKAIVKGMQDNWDEWSI